MPKLCLYGGDSGVAGASPVSVLTQEGEWRREIIQMLVQFEGMVTERLIAHDREGAEVTLFLIAGLIIYILGVPDAAGSSAT